MLHVPWLLFFTLLSIFCSYEKRSEKIHNIIYTPTPIHPPTYILILISVWILWELNSLSFDKHSLLEGFLIQASTISSVSARCIRNCKYFSLFINTNFPYSYTSMRELGECWFISFFCAYKLVSFRHCLFSAIHKHIHAYIFNVELPSLHFILANHTFQ